MAHCGNRLEGDFIWSLCFRDLDKGWKELSAVWNKGAHGVMEEVREMEQKLRFALLGFDCDNGSEFLNHHLWRYFARRKEPVQFTAPAYHKNDNAHVEQKNWTHVRCCSVTIGWKKKRISSCGSSQPGGSEGRRVNPKMKGEC